MTVLEAQNLFAGSAYPSVNFVRGLNEVLEKFYAFARWPGLLDEITLTVNDDRNIVLPAQYASLIGVSIDDSPKDLRDLSLEYLSHGPGHLDTEDHLARVLIDMGDFATDRDPPSAGVLRATISESADATKTLRVHGTGASGGIYTSGASGELITLVDPTADTTNSFLTISAINKVETDGEITITHVTSGNTLVTMLPNELSVKRHRYKLVQDTEADTVILGLAKRRFIPVQDDDDVVFPDHRGALKKGLQAVAFEDGDDLERAQAFWQAAFQDLSAEVGQNRGGAEQYIDFNPNGVRVPRIRNLY